MDKDFYKAFEDAHRGSRESILSRLRAYAPVLEAVRLEHTTPHALDIGCGRGEWLELTTEFGFQAEGVDLDPEMLQEALNKGLEAKCKDGLQALRNMQTESMAMISMFHVAEHLEFQALVDMCKDAYRVLKTGGVLLMETPNPENLTVGTSSFYSDPTHTKPLPQQLLKFVAEHSGFEQVEVMKLNHPQNIDQENNLRLVNVLFHVSPDYAVLAVKRQMTSLPAQELLSSAIKSLSGYGLETLSEKLSLQEAKHLQALESQLHRDLEMRISEIFGAFVSQNQHAVATLNQQLESIQRELADQNNKNRSLHAAIENLTIEVNTLKKIISF